MSYNNGLDRPTDYFRAKTYTGNDSGQSITFDESDNMQPDWVWIKSRTDTNSHNLWDSVRGVNKYLEADTTKVQTTVSNGVTAFDSNGFTVGNRDAINDNGLNFTSWSWKAGSTGSGTTTGSGTGKAFSYSVSTTSGFSIVKYVGNGSSGHTIPHQLGVIPQMVAIKNLDDGHSWRIGFTAKGFANYFAFNNNDASAANSVMFNNTDPTSSVFTLGSDGSTNANNENFIAYVFANVQGYQLIDQYVGNGNVDGVYVYCGFQPAYVWCKCTTTARNWNARDTKVNPFNVTESFLELNGSTAEQTDAGYSSIDILSNGFKHRGVGGDTNVDGAHYMFYAVAKHPFVTSSGVPTTAR